MKSLMVAVVMFMSFIIGGCEYTTTTSVQEQQAKVASQAANSLSFSDNTEIDNIKRRLELTSKPGVMGYVLLMNEAGQPIYYTSVKGKITSGGKRLTPPGTDGEMTRREVPSDEGTYGHSGEYIYFWTADDQYFQWNGKYFYSDRPFRTSVEPLVVNIKQ